MKFSDLDKRSQEYIDRYIRGTSKTREDALKEVIVREVIKSYKEN